MFSVALVCLTFFPSVLSQNVKFYGGAQDSKRNKWLNFGGDIDQHADSPVGNPAITQQIISWIMSGFWWIFQDSSAII